MADLIDRKELRDALYEADAVTMQGVKIINQFPAVNAVPVVRCRECKKHCEANGKHYCKFWRMYCPDDSDFFCKAGKRKEGDD